MSRDTAVIIAAYKAQATLDRAIASALAQPEAVEVCVVDDASSDGTLALAQSWAAREPRVKAIGLAVNGGPSAARNAAIAATSAPWLAILDADDYLLDGRLSALHALSGDADFVADELIRVTEGQDPVRPAAGLHPAELSFETFVLGNMGALKGPLDLGFLKPIFRRDFIDKHALRYKPAMRLGEDYLLYAIALARGARFLTCNPAGYISVERPGSLSKEHSERDLELLRDCDNEIAAVRRLNQTEQRALDRHWSSVDCRLQWRRLIGAVKDRNVGAALGTFHTPQAALYLTTRLGEQVLVRSAAGLRALKARALRNG